MKKNIIAAALVFGISTGAAQANLTINGAHNSTNINQIETYFIQANATGNADIFMQSVLNTQLGFDLAMDGLLSIWQLNGAGTLWTLVGANDNAGRVMTGTNPGSTTVYGTNVLQYSEGDSGSGFADAGLTVSLTTGNKYMVVQSENLNGPTSLADGALLSPDVNFETALAGALGQTLAVGSLTPWDYRSGFKGLGDVSGGSGEAYSLTTNYQLFINGNVAQIPEPSAVPLPAAVWLFGSALAGFTAIGRKKTRHNLVA